MQAQGYCGSISQSIRLAYVYNPVLKETQRPADFLPGDTPPSPHPADDIIQGYSSHGGLTCTKASTSATASSVSEMKPAAVSNVWLTAVWSSVSLCCLAWVRKQTKYDKY